MNRDTPPRAEDGESDSSYYFRRWQEAEAELHAAEERLAQTGREWEMERKAGDGMQTLLIYADMRAVRAERQYEKLRLHGDEAIVLLEEQNAHLG